MTHTEFPDRTVAPEVFPIGRLTMPGLRTRRLDNGVTLHILDRGEDPVNRISVYLPGGTVEAPAAGLAELAATAILEGTATASGEEIADTLDFNGSWAKGNASAHHHSLVVYSLNSRIDRVLPLIIDLVSAPAFPDHAVAVAREKSARDAELAARRVSHVARRALMELVCGPGSKVGRTPDAADYRAITPEMLRRWHDDTFSTRGMHVFLAGCITPEIERSVERSFGAIPACDGRVGRTDAAISPSEDKHEIIVERPESLQTAVCCAIPSIGRRHPDYEALRMAVIALGGYFGSRLMLNIREDKGFTYGIGAALEGYRDYSMITVSTECDNGYTPDVLREIRAEIERMKDPASYTEAEMERLKSFVATNLAAQLDSPFAVADYHVTALVNDCPPDYFDRQQTALASATPATLAATARKYFLTPSLFTTLAGNPRR